MNAATPMVMAISASAPPAFPTNEQQNRCNQLTNDRQDEGRRFADAEHPVAGSPSTSRLAFCLRKHQPGRSNAMRPQSYSAFMLENLPR